MTHVLNRSAFYDEGKVIQNTQEVDDMADHNCHVEPLDKPVDRTALQAAQIAYLAVRGMGCQRCAMRVRNGLLSLEDVLLVEVNLQPPVVVVAYRPDRVTTEDLLQAIAGAGDDGRHRYEAQMLQQIPASQADG
jgi:copper chaperone CopZ